jgi:hypothetical protein
MKKIGTWLVAGALAGALGVLFMTVVAQAGLKDYPAPVLAGHAGLRWVALRMLWGAGYALLFYLVFQHFLSGGILPSGLLFALVPFLATVLLLPLYFKTPVPGDPLRIAYTGMNSVFYSLVMVWLGRQLEK